MRLNRCLTNGSISVFVTTGAFFWRAADVSAFAPSGPEFNQDEYQKFVRMLSDDELIKAGERLRMSCGDVVTPTPSTFDRQLKVLPGRVSAQTFEMTPKLNPFRNYRLFCIASNIGQAATRFVVKTVLIADDSASVRLSVRLVLEGRHKELMVREAVDGMDAVEKAKKLRPDLILLDLAMPRLNGAEVAAVLKNEMPETPVILFTMTDLPIDSLCAAIDVDFISKADGISKLLERVDALFPPN